MKRVLPFLWFDKDGVEVMDYYKSIFKEDYKDIQKDLMPDGKLTVFSFSIKGVEFQAMNAGPEFKFNEAFSILVECENQQEVDYYWDALTANGGEESQCGWLKDKYGLSWQIVPIQLNAAMSNPDPEKAKKAMEAMLKMKKIIIADFEAAMNS